MFQSWGRIASILDREPSPEGLANRSIAAFLLFEIGPMNERDAPNRPHWPSLNAAPYNASL